MILFVLLNKYNTKASIRDRHRFIRQSSGRHTFRLIGREDRRYWMVKCRTQIRFVIDQMT